MAAVVSVVAIFVIHVAAAQEAEIVAQDSASGGYEN
jgi:hypothetical protein